jgi:hypothetical protein
MVEINILKKSIFNCNGHTFIKKIYTENRITDILPKIASTICIVPPFIASHQNAIEKLKLNNRRDAKTISMIFENLS